MRHVVNEVHREASQVAALRQQVAEHTREMNDGYGRAEFLAMNPDLDDDGIGTAIYWDTYFGADKDRHHAQRALTPLEAQFAVHRFSVEALSGSLLQYAKQGISMRWGPQKAAAPAGRQIHGIDLVELIWHGRNQAIHWEDGEFNKSTDAVLSALAQAEPTVGDYATRSIAYDVVVMLGWTGWGDFERDMLSLDP